METSSSHRHEILIVEDNDDVRAAIVALMEVRNHEPRAVALGKDALALLAIGYRPCVILLDIGMPDMDGWQVQRAIQSDLTLAALPIVVLSGVIEVVDAHARGVPGMLAKPVTASELDAAIEQFARCEPPQS